MKRKKLRKQQAVTDVEMIENVVALLVVGGIALKLIWDIFNEPKQITEDINYIEVKPGELPEHLENQ